MYIQAITSHEMSTNTTESVPTFAATCTENYVQVRDCGVLIVSGNVALTVSPQLYNGLLIALGNGANMFSMSDFSGEVTIAEGLVFVSDGSTVVMVPASTFEY